MSGCVSCNSGSMLIPKSKLIKSFFISPIRIVGNKNASSTANNRNSRLRVRVSLVESSADFSKRIERAWLISQQPRPIVCSSCSSKGQIECKWCGGTGFFILGDNMLCEVPSKNTSCIICAGKVSDEKFLRVLGGSMCCSDCQGTGFRAKWLEEPPTS